MHSKGLSPSLSGIEFISKSRVASPSLNPSARRSGTFAQGYNIFGVITNVTKGKGSLPQDMGSVFPDKYRKNFRIVPLLWVGVLVAAKDKRIQAVAFLATENLHL